MSAFKWLSIALGALAAGVVAAALSYALQDVWRAAGGSVGDVLTVAAIAGLSVTGLAWIAASAYDHDLHRAVSAAEAAASLENPSAPPRSLFGVHRIVAAGAGVAATTRSRLQEAIAQRRDADARLAVAEDHRRQIDAVVDALEDAVVVTNGFNELTWANRAAAELLGFSIHSALRRPIDQVVSDVTLVRLIRDAREAARATPRLRRQVQHRLDRQHRGGVFAVTMQSLASEPGGSPGDAASRPACAGVVTVLRNVTQQAEAAENRTDFVSRVSHELRTPLASIKGCLEMLMDGEATDAETCAEFYDIIQAETNRLSRLVDNILNITRIESGAARPRRDRVDLAALVADAVAAQQPEARAKSIALEAGDAAASAWVMGDAVMLQQAVQNLLSNALKFTPEGGRITWSLYGDQPLGYATLAVSDTGIGIPADALPHVFDKFFRVADHTRLAKGTGLGLSLVKHVVEAVHGGRVSVESVVGRGSTFRFSLPMAEDQQGRTGGAGGQASADAPLARLGAGAAESRPAQEDDGRHG